MRGYRIAFRDATPGDLAHAAHDRVTPLGGYLGAAAGEAFADSLPGLALGAWRLGAPAELDAAGRLDPDLAGSPETASLLDQDRLRRGMSEPEWRASPWWREELAFDPFMTESRARARAELHDARRWRQWLIERREAGLADGTLGFMAGLAATLPDPINLVPVTGPAFRAA